ncbi:MAG: tRNA (N6-threonylcarbamoyladenosine(37)-N6)-methyltransferase TrmO [Parachlamydiaceae bacterium]
MFTVDPIGFFHTTSSALYDVPRQSSLNPGNKGIIRLKSGLQFEQALEGLEGFDRIWVIFRFHRHSNWKAKVLPPRGGQKQGVFSTRSPHRPNFIGLSSLELQSIDGLDLFVFNHDLIDGTPILDLKPYLNYADACVSQRQGWLDRLPPQPVIDIVWSSFAKEQVDYLSLKWNCCLQSGVEHRILQSPLPYANNRIKEIGMGHYELAYRTWRIRYHLEKEIATISCVKSGYDQETLDGKKTSQWDDVPIHQDFINMYTIDKDNF